MRNGAIAGLLVAAILAGAGVGYLVGTSPLVNNPVTVQPERPFYESSNVSIAVGCCPSLPSEFVVGDPSANTFVFNIHYGPLIFGHGSTVTVVSGESMSIRVYQQNILPVTYQWANFTIAGTFNPSSLNHQNATLFDGALMMNWVVVSSVLYLHIVTK